MSKIIGIGTDLCAVSRMDKAIQREHFYERVFFESERAYLEKKENARAQSAAAMFAAKEAVAKALGTGFIRGIMPWTIEVTHDEAGKPGIVLHEAAKERFEALGGTDVHLSLTHEGDSAMAFVVIEG
ncbi:MAG: holo-[acyl-carrier-protein] synthase [Clostridiales bacterium]|nr:holo-[acyl-carrier-protein] synthase [Clostridiales bacterium]